MSWHNERGAGGLWSALRDFWLADHGLPLDERVRADAGLPPRPGGAALACRPVSLFACAWLR